jgi:stage V sporulation protein G
MRWTFVLNRWSMRLACSKRPIRQKRGHGVEITEVKVRLWDDKRLRALVTIVFENCFVVRNIKVIEGRDERLFVAMPSRRQADGTYVDIAHPITREFRQIMETRILDAYLEEREMSGEDQGYDGRDEDWVEEEEMDAPVAGPPPGDHTPPRRGSPRR